MTSYTFCHLDFTVEFLITFTFITLHFVMQKPLDDSTVVLCWRFAIDH